MSAASRALAWSFANTALSRIGTMGIGIVLARLLGPTEYGSFAIATVALMAVLSVNELGVSLAIVRWKDDPREIASTVNTISLTTSTTLAVAGYLAAPWFASSMGDASASNVVQLMMVSVIIDGAVATPAALLERRFQQAQRLVIDQINVWSGALVSVGLALLGWGAMSLAVGRIVGSMIGGVLFIARSPDPYRFGFERKTAASLLRFGAPLAGASLVVFAVSFSDQLVAGHLLGPTELGFYVLAFNLASWPVTMISRPLRSVAPATFSRLRHDEESMRRTFRSLLGLVASIALPICFMLGAAAAPIVRFVYGDQWEPAASALTWLAVMAALRILMELAYDYVVVLGRSASLFRIQTVYLVFLIPALMVGAASDGIRGIAIAQVIVTAIIVLPQYLVEFRRSGVPARWLVGRTWLPATVSCILALPCVVASQTAPASVWPAFLAGALALLGVTTLLFIDRSEFKAVRSVGMEVPLT